MKEVCAWCGKVMKEGKEPITQGICKECLAKELKEIDKLEVKEK